jgi:CheY-like chemotaxis protein
MGNKRSLKNVDLIYFIDDDDEDALLFETALSEIKRSVKLIPFSDAQQALQHLTTAAVKPDLIILDINMPVMTGFECLEILKSSSTLNDIPVIMFSTSRSPKDIQLSLNMGAHHFMSKPNTYEELDTMLRELLHVDDRASEG